MAKSKKQQVKKSPSKQGHKAQPSTQSDEKQPSQFGWIPLWGWLLIFVVPLIVSEIMFYTADRRVSMILFPLAWIGFWGTMMHRSGWRLLKKRDKKGNGEEK